MTRIDVHNHFIPNLDDGCSSLEESLDCLRTMAANGYSRIFCTPHCGAELFASLPPSEVAEKVRALQGHVDVAGIAVQLKPGGELRLTPDLMTGLPDGIVPTYGHAGKYVLADLWEPDWPKWAVEGIKWLQDRGHMVIIAHPERMPVLRADPGRIQEIEELGVLFQGNLGPIGGGDSADIVNLSHRYLREGRYFMVGTDAHRPAQMGHRMNGLRVIEETFGTQMLDELTVTNPSRLWQGHG